MPRGDRTGPMGMGPMTGRAAGFCAGAGMPGYANPAQGRGFGMGQGRGGGGGGRGWRHWYHATGLPGWVRQGGYPAGAMAPAPEVEKQVLIAQTQALQTELEGLRRRLDELEAAPPKE